MATARRGGLENRPQREDRHVRSERTNPWGGCYSAGHLRPLTPAAPAARPGRAPRLTSDTAGMSDRWLLARADSTLLTDNSRRRAGAAAVHSALSLHSRPLLSCAGRRPVASAAAV